MVFLLYPALKSFIANGYVFFAHLWALHCFFVILALKMKKKRSDLMDTRKVNDFFHTKDPQVMYDDAHEECCLEGCSVQEIREYPC